MKFGRVLVLGVAATLLTPTKGLCAVDDTQLVKYKFLSEIRMANEKEYAEKLQEQAEINAAINAALAKAEMDKKEKERIEALNSKNSERVKMTAMKQSLAAKEHLDSVRVVEEEEEASQSTTNDFNDGYERAAGKVFTKANIESSYVDDNGNDIDFYDVQIPYNLTCREVGGIAIDVESQHPGYGSTADYEINGVKVGDSKVGSRIVQEREVPKSKMNNRYSLVTSEDTGSSVYSAGNTQMYGIALASGLFPDAVGELGFYTNVWHNRTGVLADLILTDGTIIHCTVIDGIGQAHSNGKGISDGWTASSVAAAQDKTRYKLSNLNLPQYEKFFHASACHVVELNGNVQEFTDKYNIKKDGSGNNIAYVRIYKASLRDGGFTVKESRKGISCKF